MSRPVQEISRGAAKIFFARPCAPPQDLTRMFIGLQRNLAPFDIFYSAQPCAAFPLSPPHAWSARPNAGAAYRPCTEFSVVFFKAHSARSRKSMFAAILKPLWCHPVCCAARS